MFVIVELFVNFIFNFFYVIYVGVKMINNIKFLFGCIKMRIF